MAIGVVGASGDKSTAARRVAVVLKVIRNIFNFIATHSTLSCASWKAKTKTHRLTLIRRVFVATRMQQTSLSGFFAAANKKRSAPDTAAASLTTSAATQEDTASTTSTLTDEQRARIERNRVEALRKKRRASLGGVDLEQLLTDADRSWWDVLQGEFSKSYMTGIQTAAW
jgi:hypothetical protein